MKKVKNKTVSLFTLIAIGALSGCNTLIESKDHNQNIEETNRVNNYPMNQPKVNAIIKLPGNSVSTTTPKPKSLGVVETQSVNTNISFH